jgi:hypothetical protein
VTSNEVGNKYAGPNQEFAVFSALRGTGFKAHIYDGGRCIFCEGKELDDDLACIDRGQWHYTTNTPPEDVDQPRRTRMSRNESRSA